MEGPVAQSGEETKTELARRLMEGEGMDKDEAKALKLLEECVACGDAEAMLLLAEYCAFGRGMEQNKERAETLISESAKNKNKEAALLMKYINEWKGDEDIDLTRLWTNSHEVGWKRFHRWFDSGYLKGGLTAERFALPLVIILHETMQFDCEHINKDAWKSFSVTQLVFA